MIRRSTRSLLALALPLAFAAAACAEDLETGKGCPVLCPGQGMTVRDTVIAPAYVFDTTLAGFPFQGIEDPLPLALRGDTLDVRAVIRFDTLQRKFRPTSADTLIPIAYVDSAFLSIRIRELGLSIPTEFWIEAYDVYDSLAADTARLDLLPHFVAGRFLGELHVQSATFSDTVRLRIPLDSAKIREIVADTTRPLRIGLKLRGPDPVQVAMTPYGGLEGGPFIDYSVSADPAVAKVLDLQPSSLTPPSPDAFANDLIDFTLVADAPVNFEANKFSIGGFPGDRTYIRFDFPLWLTDSVNLLRARLELVQDPLYGPSDTDTLEIQTHLVLATAAVTDLHRAATLLTGGGLAAPSIYVLPSDSGVVELNLNTLVALWRTTDGERAIPSAIVLRSGLEGSSPQAARFFGATATDPTLRPRLRVSYVPAFVYGRP
jgi:hypothetical protein